MRILAILLTVVTLGVTVWVLSPGARKLPAQDYQPLSFAELGGFPYDPKKSPQVPERVQQLRQRKFRLEGFMLPIDFTGRKVRTFILSRDQNACCFGIMPAFNEWVFVRMAPEAQADVMMDEPVTVWGLLDVGPELKKGVVTSLYRMSAVAVEAPRK